MNSLEWECRKWTWCNDLNSSFDPMNIIQLTEGIMAHEDTPPGIFKASKTKTQASFVLIEMHS